MQEKFKDVQVVVGSHKSKVKQYNDQMKRTKGPSIIYKIKFTENWKLRNRNPTKTGVDSVGLPSVLQLYLLALFLSSIADTE